MIDAEGDGDKEGEPVRLGAMEGPAVELGQALELEVTVRLPPFALPQAKPLLFVALPMGQELEEELKHLVGLLDKVG